MAWSRFVRSRFALSALLCAIAIAAPSTGCGDGEAELDAGPGADGGIPVVRCGPRDDPDGDTISTADETTDDRDGDGIGNHEDTDSDGDGFSDADEAGDASCNTPPIDTDGDGVPDFLDLDANGDGVPDSEQLDDLDGDGIPDRLDTDVDGDGLSNALEWGDGETPVDTDGDGTPDLRDLDSDGDTIADRHEGAIDVDMDGIPNYRDLDSDDDGLSDAREAGDGLLETPPAACAVEINPATGLPEPDGRADFADTDSDNDGLSDGEELAIGTDPCDLDRDDDGLGDLAEGAYERFNCPDGTSGTDCGCATQASCTIPREHFYVVLPFNGPPVERDLEFGTDIRVADVFFVTDITGSMSGTLDRVQATVGTPGTGLIDRISATIPEAWFGGGYFQDFPFGSYGGGTDEAFGLAIRMTPPARGADVAAAFDALSVSGGADGPESHTEGLWQIMTGLGGTWMGMSGFGGGDTYMMHRYVGDCLDAGWGAPCFRDAALPIVVLFTDICAHEGPPGESSQCDPYTGITPAPTVWLDAVAEMNRRGAKFVGINARSFGTSCAATVGPDGSSPCYFLRRTAEETGSVDLDGNALVYDLPDGGGSDVAFSDTVVGAIETVATRVPLDLDTAVRDDPSDDEMVDAARFVKRRQPACRATPPAETCWVAPPEVTHEDAVAFVDESTFFGVIPGTRVTFRITFQNDFHHGGPTAQVFIAFIDVRTGTAVLDTRQVIVVVPANPRGPIE
ncbi:MAG: hypothetical protein RID93_01830 [Sandaracinaceae bacterium]